MKTLTGLVLVLTTANLLAADLYVAPTARRPLMDGSKRAPFTTLEAARDAIRAARARGEREPWVVHLAPGDYYLTAPFELTPQDSGTPQAPVVYRGAGAATRILGALAVQKWQPAGRSNIWYAEVPLLPDQTPAYFEMLYVNGERRPRSRFPASGFLQPQATKQTVITNATGAVYGVAELSAKEADWATLSDLPPADWHAAQLVVHHNWDTTRRLITGYAPETRTLKTQGGTWKPWNPWRENSLYYLENMRVMLETPGNWFYDRAAQRVYYHLKEGESLEGRGRATVKIVVPYPGLKQLLALTGTPAATNYVQNITFEQIAFAYTDSPRRSDHMKVAQLDPSVYGAWTSPGPNQCEPRQAAAFTEALVLADGAHAINFKECQFTQTGEYAIWLRAGCVSNTIERCYFDDLGAGGIRIGAVGGADTQAGSNQVVTVLGPVSTAFNRVDNCIITRGGRYHASATAIWIAHASDNHITHNEIRDHYYTGISVGWVWGYRGSVAQRNLIAFNRISKLGQGALGDMGGVYTLGTSFGTRVCNNIIFDVDSYTYGGWGLYPDEGSEGIVFENNLVYDTKDSSFHQHYGRDNIVRNNILAFSRQFQVAISRAEPHRSVNFENNIVYWQLPGEGLATKRYRGTSTAITEWRGNLWWCEDGAVDFNGQTFAQWQAAGRDVNGDVSDPLFRDAQARDFRLQAGSPAIKLGFRPWDLQASGVYGSRAWRRKAAMCD